MKKLHLTALLLGAALFTGMGATALSAEGKCGKAMEKPNGKCGGKKAAAKCGDAKNPSKCGKDMKSSKCGDEKKASKKAMKCGQGKCG